MGTTIQGQAIALFAFDIGYEVALEQVSALLSSIPVPPLSRKKQTPNYLQYTKPPQVLPLESTILFMGQPAHIQATVFDFGAVSIAYRWPLKLALLDLPSYSQNLYNTNLEAHARQEVEKLMERILPAIERPQLSALVEDYYLFILETLEEPLKATELLSQYHETFAQVLRFDTQLLSPSQREEVLSQPISYYENDLVLIDWNAALIYDRDYFDTVNVLEFLNVELLEARYIDAQLDNRLGIYEGLVQQRRESPIPLLTPYRKAVDELAELRIEYSLLSERIDNALKLIGDLYLARIHAAAANRFYLRDWENAISQKLEIIADLYQLLSDRLGTVQGQTLELVIILLILFEIVMAFVRH